MKHLTVKPTNMKHDTHILEEAAKTVYDRPDTHGEPEDSFERIANLWSAYLGLTAEDDFSAEDVANMMVLLKVARNAEGHYHEDNYVDIAGYAENGARLNREANSPAEVVRYINESEQDHPQDPTSYQVTD